VIEYETEGRTVTQLIFSRLCPLSAAPQLAVDYRLLYSSGEAAAALATVACH
jgi:hypothetical protein